jgi:xylulokinase
VRDVVLGADLGTSGLKVVALGDDGAVVAEAEAGYEPDRPRPGWAQSDVGTWLRALGTALDGLGPLPGARVRGLGLSGQMHGAVLVDERGAALAPALLWPDERAADQVARWRALPAADRAALANPLVAGMTGPLLAWLAEHEQDLVARAATVLLPKDAVRAALVPDADPAVTDRSDASATLLWDVPGDRWSAAAVGAAGIGAGLLPAVRPGTDVVGEAPTPLGRVPVVVGGADTPLALLAAGTEELQVNLGTGAQVLRPGWVPVPADDPPVHGYADAAGGWYAMAALRNGASAWGAAARMLGLPVEDLLAAAAAAPTGAGGVVFRPFLGGERGAVGSPEERGSWRGLGPGTTRADLARAAVEGVVFAVAAAADLLGAAAGSGPVVVTGGGTRSGVVRQLLADVLGRPVLRLGLRSASAVGAALLAARGTGLVVEPQRAPERAERAGLEPAAAGHRFPGEGRSGALSPTTTRRSPPCRR